MGRKKPAELSFRHTDGTERCVELGADVTTLGRESDCTVVISSPTISRHHARIELHSDTYILFDTGSTNGTFVNGGRVESGYQLHSGDTIQLGTSDTSLRFIDPEETLRATPARYVPTLAINEDSHTVEVCGIPVQLSPIEYKLLLHLADNYRVVCPRKECYEAVWETKYEEETCAGSFDATVATLRRKLKTAARQAGEPPPNITTLKKIGLRLDTNVTWTGRHSDK